MDDKRHLPLCVCVKMEGRMAFFRRETISQHPLYVYVAMHRIIVSHRTIIRSVET